MLRRTTQSALLALIAASLMFTSGCGSVDPNDRLAELNETNLQKVVSLYLAYQRSHGFWGPRGDSEFINFVQGYNAEKLERIGVDPSSIEGLLVSSRDGEPFKIRYGVRGSVMGSKEPVVFESTGDDGMRRVGFLDMTHREVDQAEYDQLWKNGIGSGPDRDNG